jgi:hypothetical protein
MYALGVCYMCAFPNMQQWLGIRLISPETDAGVPANLSEMVLAVNNTERFAYNRQISRLHVAGCVRYNN